MGLVRVYTALNNLIIRKLGDVGGPSSSRVDEELNRIIAWAKDAPRCIRRDFSTVNSAGAGPDVLHTFTLDTPNRLLTDGDYVNSWYAGGFSAGNDRDKAVQAQFDNQNYEGGGALDIDNSTGWVLFSRIMRTSATTVRVSHLLLENQVAIDSANVVNTFTLGFNVVARNTALTVANLNSNAITMRVRSIVTGGAAADVFQNQSIIELCQQ
jgi:hypothetical protein